MRSQRLDLQAGIYQHYKGPRYRVYGVAQHSETEQKLVVYRALYGDYGLWVRPLSMFIETVQHEGEVMPRFRLVEAASDPGFDAAQAMTDASSR